MGYATGVRCPLRHRHDDHQSGADAGAQGQRGAAAPHVHAPPQPVESLPPKAGEHAVVYFDAQSGLAGDMCTAALLDLGVPLQVVEGAVATLGLPGASVSATRRLAGAIAASSFHVDQGDVEKERSYAEIQQLLRDARLEHEVRLRAEKVFARLAEAEATVHGVRLADVHFHEVGAVDAIVDIVAASACLAYLGARLLCSPLPLGRGHVQCRHGVIPLPAPATVLCLRGLETFDSGLEAELVTPTGAAIVGALSEPCSGWPDITPLRVGWGAGKRELPDRPNALRAVLGRSSSVALDQPTHVVVECNVDDMTGEEIAHAIARLIQDGAVDAWASPIVMKKGRAAWTLHALAERVQAERVSHTLLRESSSIGLRRFAVSRSELERRRIDVSTAFGSVAVKVSGARSDGTLHVKPEFDACLALAEQHGVPLREVLQAARAAAFSALQASD